MEYAGWGVATRREDGDGLCEGRGRRDRRSWQEGKEGRGEVWCEWRPRMGWWVVNGRAADRAADWAADEGKGAIRRAHER